MKNSDIWEVECSGMERLVDEDWPHCTQLVFITNMKGQMEYDKVKWASLLGLAMGYGWIPKGTILDYDEEYRMLGYPGLVDDAEAQRELRVEAEQLVRDWPGYYDTNSYQVVTPEDAHNLADALDRALKDDYLWKPTSKQGRDRVAGMALKRTDVESLAAFCKRGVFQIS